MMSSFRALLVLGLAALFWVGCQPSAPEASSYQFVRTWGMEGDASGEFSNPVGITIAEGRVYVSDTGNNRIQVFGPES